MVNGEEEGGNVIRSWGNIKKPPQGWLCLGSEFDYGGQDKSASPINSSALAWRGEAKFLELFGRSGHRSEMKPSSCIEPKGWAVSNMCWQPGLSGNTLYFHQLCSHTFIYPWWHFSSTDTCDSKPCGSLSPFPRASIPAPSPPVIVIRGSTAGGEEGSRVPGCPWLPTGTVNTSTHWSHESLKSLDSRKWRTLGWPPWTQLSNRAYWLNKLANGTL